MPGRPETTSLLAKPRLRTPWRAKPRSLTISSGRKGSKKNALSELRNPADTGVLPLDDSLQTLSDAGLTSECFATVTKLENPTKPTPISVKPLTPENTPVLYATAWNLAKERISEGAWTYQWYAGDAKDAAMDAFKAIPAEDGGTSPSLAISNDFAQKYDGKCLRVSISDADGTTVYGPKKATKYTTLTATNAIEAPQASEAVDLDYAHVVNDESKFSDSGWQGWPESVSSARVGDTLYAAGEAFDEDAYVSTFYFAKDGVGFTWQVEEDGSWVEVATGGSFTVPESCAGKNVRAVADGGGRKAEGESISVASLEPESVDLGYAYVVADEGKFEDFSWWPASDKSASAGDTLHAAACKPDDKYFSNPLFSKDGVTFSWQVEQEDGTWKGVQEGGDSFDVPESCAGTRIRVVADAGKQQATSSEVEIRAAGAVDVYLVELSESGAVAEGTVLKATAYKGDYSSKSPITQGVTYTWEWCEGDPDNSVANPEWHVVEGVTGDTLTLGSDFVDPNAGEGWKGRWIRVTADAGGAGKTVGDVSAVGPVIGSGTYWIHSASAVNVTAGDAAPFRAGDTVNVTAKKFAANGYNADGAIDPDDFSITWYISEESDLGGSYVELDDENAHAKSFTIPESYEGKYLRYRICAGANAYETSMSIDPVAPADAVRVAKVELSCSGFSDLIVPGDTLTARALDDRGNDVTDQVSWSWGYASTATSTYPTPISGETSSAYTLPDKSVYKGKYIYAIATDGTNARVRAVTPSQVKTTGDVKLRSVSIKEDVAQVGKQLTAQAMKLTNALIEPVDAAFDKVSYQWGYVDARDANPSVDPTLFHAIDGATESTFTPTDRVEGKYIVVRATNNTKPTTTVYSTYRPYEGINQQVDALGPVLSSSACALSSVSVASSGQGAQADCFVVPQARTVVGGIESDVSDKVVVEYRWFVSDTADDEGTAVDGGYDPATGKLALRDFEGMYLHATATASANTVAGKPFLVLPADTYDLMRATVDAAAPAVGDTVSVSVQARNLSGSVYGDDVTSGVSLQWYVADEPDGEFAKIEHATGSSLVVPDTAAGSYLKVVATSGASVVESSVVLVKSEADSEVVQATGAVVGVDKNGNDQTWAEAISYDMKKGDTAADLSERLFEEAGIEASYDPNGSWGWYLDSITSPFDKSQTLGYDADTGRYWQLFVNGKSASDGAGGIALQPGDSVVWYYSAYGATAPDAIVSATCSVIGLDDYGQIETWLSDTPYEVNRDATVADLTAAMAKSVGLGISFDAFGGIRSATSPFEASLTLGANGATGMQWRLFVNGVLAPTSADSTAIHAGDRVVWVYSSESDPLPDTVSTTCEFMGVDADGTPQVWAKSAEYVMVEGSTGDDLTRQALLKTGLKASYGLGQYGFMLESVTSPFDENLTLATYKPFAGKYWQLFVGGNSSDVGASGVTLENGTAVVWSYSAWGDQLPVAKSKATGSVIGIDANGNAQTWAEPAPYEFNEGDTAADLSERLFEEAGIEASYDPNGSWGWYLDSITSPFDKSQTLGYDADTGRYWQLFVNGKSASDGAGGIALQPGDSVVWYYSAYGDVLPSQIEATCELIGLDPNGNTQIWSSAKKFVLDEGATAADLSERLFEEAGIEASYDPNGSWGWYLDSITSPFDKSQTLGYDADTGRYWQLFVNGKSASDGAGLVFLQPGDEVVWYYSTWGSDLPDPDDLVIDPDAERPDYDSSWPGFASGSNGSTVTNVPTPTGAADLAWSFDYKNGAAFAGVSDPLIVNGDVYLISGGTLMKIDAQEGKLLASAGIGGSIRYFCRPAYADGLIIVPTDDGSLAAFTADALTCVWKTDALDTKDGTLSYQALSTLTVNGGYVYAGFTQAGAANDPGTAGALRCVRISDGSIMWTHAAESSDTGKAEGYYWAGAAAAGSDIVIGDESGTVSLVEGGGDAFKVKSSVSLGKPCRSTVVAMDGGTSFLVVTSDGVLHKLTRDGDKLSAAGSVSFSSASTSTPAVSGGKAFVCGSSGEYGALFVIDLASMKVERTVLGGKGYAQSAPLVSVQGDGTYVYFTCNAMPGGVYSYKLGESSAVQLYTPDGALQNYCTASIVADEDGNLYYTNDSGTLFALKGQAGYRVTFDSMGGSYVPRGMTVQGKPLVRPDDPIRAGYVFGGWFVDEGCTRAWDFSNPVTSEMTLYAKWTKKDDGQGGGVPGGSGSSGSGDLLQPAAPFAKSLPTGGAPAATHAPLSQEAAKEETKDTKADRTDKADGATRSEARTSSGMGVDADNGSSDGTLCRREPARHGRRGSRCGGTGRCNVLRGAHASPQRWGVKRWQKRRNRSPTSTTRFGARLRQRARATTSRH